MIFAPVRDRDGTQNAAVVSQRAAVSAMDARGWRLRNRGWLQTHQRRSLRLDQNALRTQWLDDHQR
jgi:hypothetical protein